LAGRGPCPYPLSKGVEKEVTKDRPVRPQADSGHLGEGQRAVTAGGLKSLPVLLEGEGHDRLVEAFELIEGHPLKPVGVGEGVGEGEGVSGEHFFGLVGCVIASPTMRPFWLTSSR